MDKMKSLLPIIICASLIKVYGTYGPTEEATVQTACIFFKLGIFFRNFVSPKAIKKTLTAMAASKLNIFHWHITDTASFPYVSKSHPELSEYGAYSPQKVYTDAIVRDIIEFANVRGIRVVPELDAPAHVGEGWQNSGVITCFNWKPWSQYCVEPPCGQFDPSKPELYDILEDSYQVTKLKVEPATQPSFISSSQVFKVKDQDTVVLPCEVANPGPYLLAWKKGIAVLSAGKTLVSPDPRVTLNPDYSLEIKEIGPQDAGDYVCQIGTLQPKEITHTVEILVPPRIHYVTSNGRVEMKKGSTVRLECKASGNPVPKVTWTRKNNLLPGGEQSVTTPILTLDKVDRHHAGVYQCVASNGVGEDVKEQIFLHVLYPPEITVERPVVYSGEGMEAQLVCIVHGENQPEVLWYRDTMQLDTTEHRIMESRGSRHTLVIRKVSRQDFGNYTCAADNQLGKTRKNIQLTGKPNPVKFVSPPNGRWRENYNISWEVESLSPIEEYKLLYRKLPNSSGVTSDSQPQPLHHQSLKSLTKKGENKTFPIGGFVYSRPIKDRRLEWRDVILPAIPAQPVGMQSMSYVIRGLEPGQQYEARVQARNKFGWSPESAAFTFKTTETENAVEDVQSVRSFRNNAQYYVEINKMLVILLLVIVTGFTTSQI